MKKFPTILLAFPVLCSFLPAQDTTPVLDQDQKKELLDSLSSLKDSNAKQKMKLAQAGIAALSPLAANPGAAMDFYLKCQKKTEFDDQKRPEKEWKQWKTSNKEQISSAANKRAIQYQARWAIETLKAFMEGKDYKPERYIPQATALINEILQDKDVVIKSEGPFNSSIIDGPIGKTLHLGGCSPEQWEGNIVANPAGVVNHLCLTPAKEDKNVAKVRESWNMIIGIVVKHNDMEEQASPSRKPEELAKRKSQMLSFLSLIRELDCYDCGDELRAMTNAVNLIKRQTEPQAQEGMINMALQRLEQTGEDKN